VYKVALPHVRKEGTQMPIALIQDFDGDATLYDAVLSKLDIENNPPAGMLVHTAGEVNGRWRIVDVWESRADFDRFFQERLGAAIQQTAQEHGREVIPPEETQYELHNLIKS